LAAGSGSAAIDNEAESMNSASEKTIPRTSMAGFL
jgi:hypothetical protein